MSLHLSLAHANVACAVQDAGGLPAGGAGAPTPREPSYVPCVLLVRCVALRCGLLSQLSCEFIVQNV
jgi:hypothetical protein